jgi:hypothetical protein
MYVVPLFRDCFILDCLAPFHVAVLHRREDARIEVNGNGFLCNPRKKKSIILDFGIIRCDVLIRLFIDSPSLALAPERLSMHLKVTLRNASNAHDSERFYIEARFVVTLRCNLNKSQRQT